MFETKLPIIVLCIIFFAISCFGFFSGRSELFNLRNSNKEFGKLLKQSGLDKEQLNAKLQETERRLSDSTKRIADDQIAMAAISAELDRRINREKQTELRSKETINKYISQLEDVSGRLRESEDKYKRIEELLRQGNTDTTNARRILEEIRERGPIKTSD